ncbi:MAG: hypothetical protein O3B13_13485 [Planctomycetota bacterium]|nr:hypothetical protein [Planctomycetota bacterium]
MMFWVFAGLTAAVLVIETVVVAYIVRRKHLDRWLPGYLFGMSGCPRLNLPEVRTETLRNSSDEGEIIAHAAGHRTPWERYVNDEPLDVFIAVCDHFEPDNAGPARHVADARVARWCSEYPQLFGDFADSSGRPPQHSFFYPQDEYFVPEYLDQLRELRDAGLGDVEIHLHHDNDTDDGVREKLESFRETLFHRHGLLRRDPESGEIVYGFIHGNWALCNSRPDGRLCGVNDELTVLRQTGCYADFTMPSAPEFTQTRIINSVYYAASDTHRPMSHDRGTAATLGVSPPLKHLLLMQGPLTFDWHDRTRGVLPRIENGDLLHRRPPTLQRFEQWLRCGVHVSGRPDWCFIKLHTHGCKDGNIETLLGPETQKFHKDLAQLAKQRTNFRYHYVTAWEMAQLVHQAEFGITVPQLKSAEALVLS